MRVFKRTYKTRSGAVKTSKYYIVEVKDHLGKMRKYPGYTSRKMTAAMGHQIELLAAYKNSGCPPDAQLCQWIQSIPDKLRNRLVEIGLIDPDRAASAKPLSEHLEDYRDSIGGNTKHARNTYSAVVALFEQCKFVFWNDIQANILYNHLARLKRNKEISQRTFNFRLKAAKAFCNWMVQNRMAAESPIAFLKPVQITERTRERRVLEPDELMRFLESVSKDPVRYGMTGYERYLLYRFAVETGLRSNEIRNLRVVDFDFENLTVTVRAVSSKHKRQDVLVLRPETAKLLKDFMQNKMPNAKSFGGTYKHLTDRTAEMLQEDLADTKEKDKRGNTIKEAIPYVDEVGRVFDFHSLRHQTGSMLARYGVHPVDAKAHMRHSDINLTLRYYTHLRRGAEVETAAKLPDLSLSMEKKSEDKTA